MAPRIAIVHFLPLEKYPPVMNLVNTLSKSSVQAKVWVFSDHAPASVGERFLPENPKIKIVRPWIRYKPGPAEKIGRLLFLARIAFQLLLIRPSAVLSYESYSMLPVWLMTLFSAAKRRILIHYHEYESREEAERTSGFYRLLKRVEKKLWAKASWISQTHPLRMERFINDYPGLLPPEALKIVPNYPPQSWTGGLRPDQGTGKKLVYVGVLGLETMYLPEVSAWLDGPGKKYSLDMYAFQVNPDVRKFLSESGSSRIRLHEGVHYYDLPEVLRLYDAGLILYKGHIPNYTLIAPNKLFEYLSCGLEVWLPKQMLGSMSFVNDKVRPRVLAVDFENLTVETDRLLPPGKGLPLREEVYICEEAFKPLVDALIQEN